MGVSTNPVLAALDPHVKPPGADDYGEQDSSGVDVSLIPYMLSQSPLERLRLMSAMPVTLKS